MTATRPSIAFFGATGGCASNALVKSLQDGYKCSALARTPSKLEKLLETTHNIPKSTIDANLTIIQGDVKNVDDVKRTLLTDGAAVDIVVFGIGGSPKLVPSLRRPVTLEDPSICEDGMKTVIEALQSLKDDNVKCAPTVVTISSTGTSDVARDVPLPMYALYHYVLATPHADKKKMEDALIAASQPNNRTVGGFVIVRPTLLVDGEGKGVDALKVGWERPKSVQSEDGEEAPGPALGYSVARADVGGWIFREVVKGNGKWNGRCVTLSS